MSATAEASHTIANGTPRSQAVPDDHSDASKKTITADDERKSARRNFFTFAAAYAVCFESAIMAFDLVSVLDPTVMRIGNGILFGTAFVVSLLAGVIIDKIGPKRGAILGSILMAVFSAGVAAAMWAGDDVTSQWIFYLVAAVSCGWSQPLLCASLGPMVDGTAVWICGSDANTENSLKRTSADLIGSFTMINNFGGLFIVLLGSVLVQVLGMPASVLTASITLICLVAAIMISFCCQELPSAVAAVPEQKSASGLRALARFYTDPRAWLLSFGSLAIGAFTSWKAATIAPIAQGLVGEGGILVLYLIQNVINLVFAKVFSMLMQRSWKNLILALGCVSILASVWLYSFTDLAEQGWWATPFYVLAGLAWPAYNIATRASVADHFRGELAAHAFAALILEQNFVQMVVYFVSAAGGHSSDVLSVVLACLACLIIPGSLWADRLTAKQLELPR